MCTCVLVSVCLYMCGYARLRLSPRMRPCLQGFSLSASVRPLLANVELQVAYRLHRVGDSNTFSVLVFMTGCCAVADSARFTSWLRIRFLTTLVR